MRIPFCRLALATALAASLSTSGQVQRNHTVDFEGRYPNAGVLLITATEDNPIGVPPGVFAFCSGVLIHHRALLTAGHCTGPGSAVQDRVVAIASDGGIDCVRPDIRARVDTHEAREWIRSMIRHQLGEDIDIDGDDQ